MRKAAVCRAHVVARSVLHRTMPLCLHCSTAGKVRLLRQEQLARGFWQLARQADLNTHLELVDDLMSDATKRAVEAAEAAG